MTQSQSSDVSNRFVDENITAEQHIAENNLKAAAEILVSIVENDPLNARAFNNMGIISWTRKAWEDAYLMFVKSVELKPDYTDALINLFDAALKLHRVDTVTPLFNNARNANPDDEEICVLADSINQQGDAIYRSERAFIVGRYHPDIAEAERLMDDGKLFLAMEKFLKVNDTEGHNAESFNGLGIISYYQGRYQDAYSLFIESLKLNPLQVDTYHNLVDAARLCGHARDVVDIYAVFAKEFPVLDEHLKDTFDALAQEIESIPQETHLKNG